MVVVIGARAPFNNHGFFLDDYCRDPSNHYRRRYRRALDHYRRWRRRRTWNHHPGLVLHFRWFAVIARRRIDANAEMNASRVGIRRHAAESDSQCD
jgi:hypothetical protein